MNGQREAQPGIRKTINPTHPFCHFRSVFVDDLFPPRTENGPLLLFGYHCRLVAIYARSLSTMNPFTVPIKFNVKEGPEKKSPAWIFGSNTRPGIKLNRPSFVTGPVFSHSSPPYCLRVWNCIIRQGSVHLTRHVFSYCARSIKIPGSFFQFFFFIISKFALPPIYTVAVL